MSPGCNFAIQAYCTSPSIFIVHSLHTLALKQLNRMARSGCCCIRMRTNPSRTESPSSNGTSNSSYRPLSRLVPRQIFSRADFNGEAGLSEARTFHALEAGDKLSVGQ